MIQEPRPGTTTLRATRSGQTRTQMSWLNVRSVTQDCEDNPNIHLSPGAPLPIDVWVLKRFGQGQAEDLMRMSGGQGRTYRAIAKRLSKGLVAIAVVVTVTLALQLIPVLQPPASAATPQPASRPQSLPRAANSSSQRKRRSPARRPVSTSPGCPDSPRPPGPTKPQFSRQQPTSWFRRTPRTRSPWR